MGIVVIEWVGILSSLSDGSFFYRLVAEHTTTVVGGRGFKFRQVR